MKTNDVSGRYPSGVVGFAIEVGRPGISASFEDVEKITIALSDQVEFGSSNPVTALLDVETGRLRDPSVRGERVLSAIIECKVAEKDGVEVLKLLEKISHEIETVFSLCVINRCVDYQIPFKPMMEEAGLVLQINGKVNVGLGRPLV